MANGQGKRHQEKHIEWVYFILFITSTQCVMFANNNTNNEFVRLIPFYVQTEEIKEKRIELCLVNWTRVLSVKS